MEELYNISRLLIQSVSLDFVRSLYGNVHWQSRLIGIKGSRGVGKTTLLLQYLHRHPLPTSQKLYISLDDIYFSNNNLLEFGSQFYKLGGKLLVIDEVHKYPNWSQEIKNLYDRYVDLQIIFTGSSIMEINKLEGDLSRRAVMYHLKGLSFREYLHYQYGIALPALQLNDILDHKIQYEKIIPQHFKPLQHFKEYLQYGYYPFIIEGKQVYYQKIRQLTRVILENDMTEIKGYDVRQAKKMLQLLYIIAQQVPFKPNITALASKTNIHRNSITSYLYYMHEAQLIALLSNDNYSVAALQKPEKIFLENTNLQYALADAEPNIGSVRETFFYNQLSYHHNVVQSKVADFFIDQKYTFEIGGLSKNDSQILGIKDAWIVKDDLEVITGNAIPLWMFGFLY